MIKNKTLITSETKGSTNNAVNRIGFYSAIFASIFSIIYIVGQLAEWAGLLGSGGGPDNPSTALGLGILLTPSLLLAPAFVILMVSINHIAPEDKKIYSQIGLAFSVIYATLCSLNYYVQLTVVAPRLLAGNTSDVSVLLFTPYNTFPYAMDLLGYSFMSLSTLAAAFVFSKTGFTKYLRWFMIANGVILPFLAFQTYIPSLIWFASLWSITFTGSTILLAIFFKKMPLG
jgi:hypothetical protein